MLRAEARRENARALRRESAATPVARECWRWRQSSRRACGGPARAVDPNPMDRASRSAQASKVAARARRSRACLAEAPRAAQQHRGESIEYFAHLRDLVG